MDTAKQDNNYRMDSFLQLFSCKKYEWMYCLHVCPLLKGAQAWDVRGQDFYTNQSYMGTWRKKEIKIDGWGFIFYIYRLAKFFVTELG